MESAMKAGETREPYRKLIIAVSIILPVAVAALFGIRIEGYDFSYLPPVYASLNAITSVLLVAAVVAIKNGKRKIHQFIINICVLLSAAFLVMYVLYHMTSDPTPFGGEGTIKVVYFFILITHILLSVVIIPLVLFTYVRGWSGNYTGHRKLARYAFPLWLYVAVTGVIVYLMISPYYQ